MKTASAHLLWLASCLPAYRRFRNALENPEVAQQKRLLSLLRNNAASVFGREHGFAALRTIEDFQNAVPPRDYAGLQPWIDRAREGEINQLTCEPIRRFEKTTGSSSAPKYIPYTASLQKEFQAAIRAWIADLYFHRPRLMKGPAYWSITPVGREREITPSGIPVGFETDAEYLGKVEQWLTKTLFAVPAAIARIDDLDTATYLTLRWLLQTPQLALISIWNPSFLTLLWKKFQRWQNALLDDLAQGTARPPFSHSPLPSQATVGLRAEPVRAAKLAKTNPLTPAHLWPELNLISCWTEASAALALPEMQTTFAETAVQGKGLLATEGVVSLPLWGQADSALAVTSHFYEFEEPRSSRVLLAHELETSREYTVLLTTGGGLWRYRLGDRVRVTGRIKATPLLRFLQREGGVVDLRGEKLMPSHVDEIFLSLRRGGVLKEGFAMLAPAQINDELSYVLFCETPQPHTLGEVLDSALRKNPHYDYCRRLEQLGPIRIFRIHGNPTESFLRRCEEMGQRTGNIKPTSLHGAFDWEKWFEGEFVAS